jgi:hypothetical protein
VCFAIAVQDGNNGWSTGIDSNPDGANRQALLGCAKMGFSCTIREEFCDSVSEVEIQAAEQAEYQQYVQNWNVCFGRVATGSFNEQINYCDYALTFPRANQNDRSELLKQRGSLIAARNQELANKARAALDEQREREEFHLYELRWRHCFDANMPGQLDGQIASCEYGLAFRRAIPADRVKLVEQRDALIFARDELAKEAQVTQGRPVQEIQGSNFGTPVLQAEGASERFGWFGMLFIEIGMALLGVATLVTIIAWALLAGRARLQTFTKKEVKLIGALSATLLIPGILFIFYGHRLPPGNLTILFESASFRAEIFGNSLVALALGSWVGSLVFKPNFRVSTRTLALVG